MSRPGCERIVRYAFEYARKNNRRKVACFVKDNIMKMTDGLFAEVFREIGEEYPEMERGKWIVDIGAARLADTPTIFDVIVMPNLYGDIMSDIAAQITGSVGLGGSANIGDSCAMFEAIHGSAPDIADKNLANPAGMLLGAGMMLVHIDQPEAATRVHNAWLKTIEDGIHTGDIYRDGRSRRRVGTSEFTMAVCERLGQLPETLAAVEYTANTERQRLSEIINLPRPRAQKDLVGVDVFIDSHDKSAEELGEEIKALAGPEFELIVITNGGVKVWPDGYPETNIVDHWRCRFRAMSADHRTNHAEILRLLDRIQKSGLDFIKTEHLCNVDGKPGYSLGQGE